MESLTIEKYINVKKCHCIKYNDTWELQFLLPSMFGQGWFVFEDDSRFFVVKKVLCGKQLEPAIKQIWSDLKLKYTNVYLEYGTFPVCNINKPTPYLLGILDRCSSDTEFVEKLDTLLLDLGMSLQKLSGLFTPAYESRYNLDRLCRFAKALGFDYYDLGLEKFSHKQKIDSNALNPRIQNTLDEIKKLKKELDSSSGTTDFDWCESTEISFSDVGGMESIKEDLIHNVIWPIKNQDQLKKYGLTPPSGILLCGCPGVGKTFLARAIATECGSSFKEVSSSELASPYIHESANKIHELFKSARKHAPSVILLDELDQYVGARGSEGMEKRHDEVSAFLTEMNNCGSDGVLVIGTTNRVEDLDPAVRRHGRFDLHYEIMSPDKKQRELLLLKTLEARPCEDVNITALAELSDGFVASDIVYMTNTAALNAAMSGRNICQTDLEDALVRCRQTVGMSVKIGFKS